MLFENFQAYPNSRFHDVIGSFVGCFPVYDYKGYGFEGGDKPR